MDEPKLNKIQKKHLRDTPAGRYYENREKPGTGERYNPIQQKYLKDAGWTFDKEGAVKTAPAPAKIQAHRPMPTPTAKTAALKPKDPSSRSGE